MPVLWKEARFPVKTKTECDGKENSLKCSLKHTAVSKEDIMERTTTMTLEKDDDEWAEYVCMPESRLMTQPWNLISHGSRNQ